MKTLVLILFTYPLIAQPSLTRAEQFISAVNQKIASSKQGYMDCRYRWKSAMKTDTSQKSGRIWFFKAPGDPDSIAQFVVTGDFWEAYDGTEYHLASNSDKSITSYPVSQKGGIRKVMDSRLAHRLVFKPFLYGPEKTPLKVAKFRNALMDTFVLQGQKFLRITVLDSFPNDAKFSPKDPDLVQRKETYEFDLPQMNLRKRADWMLYTYSPQYLEQYFSPIHILPDSITFERAFNLDSLLGTGYTQKYQAVSGTASRPKLIAVGDTLPPFILQDLEGKNVSITDFSEGLVLLDFWYKSCAPCLMSMPATERLYQKYRTRGLHLYGVNGTDKDPDDLRNFLTAREVNYPCLLDPGKKLAAALGVTGYPTFVLLDAKTHRVIYAQSGFAPEVEAELAKATESWKP